MRRCFLVCYDIRDAKRLRHVHRIVKGYGESWQYSIFLCVLKAIDRVRLQAELEEVMNLRDDQCLLIDLGEDLDKAHAAATVLGQSLAAVERGTVVI